MGESVERAASLALGDDDDSLDTDGRASDGGEFRQSFDNLARDAERDEDAGALEGLDESAV